MSVKAFARSEALSDVGIFTCIARRQTIGQRTRSVVAACELLDFHEQNIFALLNSSANSKMSQQGWLRYRHFKPGYIFKIQ